MTYKEAYRACKTFKELELEVKKDTKVAIFLGGSHDRLKAIQDAMNEIVKEKGW